MVSVLDTSSLLQNPVNPTYAYVCAFIDELQRVGMRNAVICPGSRSTPLAIAFVAQPDIKTWMHIDERSAAFFALGMAKRLDQPVALLCTSGTAAANFFPAIVEAKLTHVPLLVLTADRPHELRDNGAPQSIDQNRLYGTYVKWFVEVALPEATNAALRYIRTTADRAVALTKATPAGPVHLNFPFREPLTPEPIANQPLPPLEQRDTIAWMGRPDNAPYVDVHNATQHAVDAATVAHIANLASTTQCGLIIAGPYNDPALTEPLVRLAHRLGYPILADPLSQVRGGSHDQSHVLSSYDAFLRIDAFTEQMVPELVLRFGAMPTSKPVLTYLKRYPSCPLIVFEANEGWEEPTQLATELIHTDPIALCQNLITVLERHDMVEAKLAPTLASHRWLTTWQRADQVTKQALQTTILDFQQPFEGRIFTELAHLLPDGATLYTGNSMPVRDLDTFFWSSEHSIQLMGNRGANGIDGIISSALGASAASEEKEPTVLVIGDLSFLHDLNGLLAARLHQLNLTIVLVNNDGGGIFSFLPQAAYPEHFEQLFGTPTGLDFSLAVQMYGGHFQRVEDWEQFRKAVNQGIQTGGLRVVEVVTERESNVRMHRDLWQSVKQALENTM